MEKQITKNIDKTRARMYSRKEKNKEEWEMDSCYQR